MTTPDIITAAALVIGDEILSGRTRDQNIATIARHLSEIGIQLREVRIIPDDEADIIAAVNALRARYTYVFSTGGIGPTHDDITADSMAKAFGVSIGVDPRAVAIMQPSYHKRGLELNETRLRMARIPAGATLIANSVSMAPGFMIGNVIVMAGVPDIMEVMLKDATQHLTKGAKMCAESIILNRPESDIAVLFADHQRAFPGVIMGSYPSFNDGKYKTELVLRSCQPERLAKAAKGLREKLKSAGLL